MNVYQRPLFRQAGGPVAQPMAAPQMAAPEAAIGQAEAEASAGMQQVGLDYLAQTMGGIDAATDAKSLIDALRGNNKPIEARYAELAQLVGEQDARQTPESVLALVQPTIMMTEQGAVDSGIGELMQNVVGQVEMETEGGAPTPMAGGVGSLMMAGAPQAEVGQPPVQNFRYGGLVQRFQEGGAAQGRLGQLYSEMLPVYQSVLGPGGSEEAKAQALFAIAQAAGQFAAGRGPQGEDLRGASPAAAFAANLGGLSGALQQQAGARAQEERALRLAALQGAQQEYSAERAAARAAAGRETPLGSFYDILDAEGKVVDTVPIATRAEFAAVQARVPEGGTFRPAFQKDAAKTVSVLTLYGPDGKPKSFDIGSPEGAASARSALGSGLFTDVAPAAAGFEAVVFNRVNPDTGAPELITVNVASAAGLAEAERLMNEGFTTSNLLVQNVLDQQKEERAVSAEIDKEVRLLGRTLDAEARQNLRDDLVFERSQVAARDAEARAEGRTIAAELRARGYRVEDRDLDLLAEIAREERARESTLSAEERAAALEQKRFERDQEAVLASENRQEGRVIAAELRARGYSLEDRDLDLAAQIAREERDEKRTLSAEERANRYEQLRAERDQAERLAAENRQEGRDMARELRQRGYAVEDRDLALVEKLASEERVLERTLSAEARAQRLEELRFQRDEAAKIAAEDRAAANRAPQLFTLYPQDGGAPRDLNGTTPEGRAEINRLIDEGWSSQAPAQPGTLTERQQALLSDPIKLDQWQKGQLTAGEENQLVITLQDYISPHRDITGAVTQRPIPDAIRSVLQKRQEQGLSTYGIAPELFSPQAAAAEDTDLGEVSKLLRDADLESATGVLASLGRGVNFVLESTIGEVVPGASGTFFTGSENGAKALNALAQATERFYLEGRTLSAELERLQRELVRPSPGLTDAAAIRGLQATRASLLDQLRVLEGISTNPRDYSSTEVSNARRTLAYGRELVKTYDSALRGYGMGAAERPKAEDFFR